MTPQATPPCRAACPVRTDAGGYARLVAEGRYDEAYAVICRTNPFPSVCGHICQRLCEKHCRRAKVDAALALRALKKFVVLHADRPDVPRRKNADALAGKRVAVIGAGPSGLTAALDLRLRGASVKVYERLDRPGGMLNVIPRYRLPQEALESDVAAIIETGIEVAYKSEIGGNLTVARLIEQGAEAVIVTTGLSRSRGIAVPGFGAQQFIAAVPWMTDVWLGNRVDVGARTVVVGGGNVAVDVARTARRLGAKHVAMVCLESRDEIPAEAHEIALAEAEGIRVLPRHALKRVMNRDGKIAAVELMSVLSVLDSDGRFKPTYDPAHIRTLHADMVILSIGQAPDRSWAQGANVRADARGRIAADTETHGTSNDRIFLAGESLRGPGSAIDAVADGHHVAEVVARFLDTGQILAPERRAALCPLDPFPEDAVENLRRMASTAEEAQPFAPAEPSLDEAAALREAGRCLGCTMGAVIDEAKCASCLTCFRVCPLDAIEIGDAMLSNPVRCQACGLCASICPARAIDLTYWRFGEDDLSTGPADGAEPEVAIVCRHATDTPIESARLARVPCLARLKAADLLNLFLWGYRTISLHACSKDQCKYGEAWTHIRPAVDQVQSVVEGIQPEARIVLCAAGTTADKEDPT